MRLSVHCAICVPAFCGLEGHAVDFTGVRVRLQHDVHGQVV